VASLPVENKYFDLKKKSWIDWLHEKEILVYYWTVNTPDLMRTLAERGADGIMSDDPGLIRRTLLPDGGTAP
jgi:glycerophosphoryl diester phosphodiesterase